MTASEGWIHEYTYKGRTIGYECGMHPKEANGKCSSTSEANVWLNNFDEYKITPSDPHEIGLYLNGKCLGYICADEWVFEEEEIDEKRAAEFGPKKDEIDEEAAYDEKDEDDGRE